MQSGSGCEAAEAGQRVAAQLPQGVLCGLPGLSRHESTRFVWPLALHEFTARVRRQDPWQESEGRAHGRAAGARARASVWPSAGPDRRLHWKAPGRDAGVSGRLASRRPRSGPRGTAGRRRASARCCALVSSSTGSGGWPSPAASLVPAAAAHRSGSSAPGCHCVRRPSAAAARPLTLEGASGCSKLRHAARLPCGPSSCSGCHTAHAHTCLRGRTPRAHAPEHRAAVAAESAVRPSLWAAHHPCRWKRGPVNC